MWGLDYYDSIYLAQNYSRQILKVTTTPFLLLEDDAALVDDIHPIVNYPSDANLIYLGGSSCGNDLRGWWKDGLLQSPGDTSGLNEVGTVWPHRMVYTERPDQWIQTYNMHTTHAMLFIDEEAKKEIINIWDTPSQAVDMTIADWTRDKKVYCLKHPIWYQTDGHSDLRTRGYYV